MRKLSFALILIIVSQTLLAQTGRSLHFDGSGDYIDIGTPIFDVNNGKVAYTIEAWIKTGSGLDDCIVCQYNWPGDYRFQFEIRGDKLNWWKGVASVPNNQISILSNQNVNDNTWHHVAGTVDTLGNVKLYIDGVLDGTGVDTFKYNNINTIIGHRLNSSTPGYFNGNIDELRIWRTTRTANQIMDNMCPGTEFDTSGLIVYYKFNQGIAGGNNASINTSQDETTNMHNGTLNGFTLSGTTSNWVSTTPCFPASTNDIKAENLIQVWPNPTTSILEFNEVNTGDAYVYDLQGRIILQGKIVNSRFDISSLPKGMYTVLIPTRRINYISKFIVEE